MACFLSVFSGPCRTFVPPTTSRRHHLLIRSEPRRQNAMFPSVGWWDPVSNSSKVWNSPRKLLLCGRAQLQGCQRCRGLNPIWPSSEHRISLFLGYRVYIHLKTHYFLPWYLLGSVKLPVKALKDEARLGAPRDFLKWRNHISCKYRCTWSASCKQHVPYRENKSAIAHKTKKGFAVI